MDRKDELPLYLPACDPPFPQLLIKGCKSTETSAPRLRPHFTPEPGCWIKAFLAHPYRIAEQISRSAHHNAASRPYPLGPEQWDWRLEVLQAWVSDGRPCFL